MGKVKYDGVVEAVRYNPDGKVGWVRAFVRRGPTFSDRVLLDRQTLIDHLKSGKKFMAGKRVPFMASTFETSQPMRLHNEDGQELLVIGEQQGKRDQLEGVPLI